MKRALLYLFLFSFALGGCNKKVAPFQVVGNVTGLTNDTILVFVNQDSIFRVDTILAKGGKFNYSLPIDTLTILKFLFNKQQPCTVYGDKQWQITLHGDVGRYELLRARGSMPNNNLTLFKQQADSLSKLITSLRMDTVGKSVSQRDSISKAYTLRKSALVELLQQKAAAHLKEKPNYLINLEILDHYFVNIESPNLAQIKELIAVLKGDIQDYPYTLQLTEQIELQGKLVLNQRIYALSIKDERDSLITLNSFKDKYLLISFWDPQSDSIKQHHRALRKIYATYKSKKVAILSVSLDPDKEGWKAQIKADTLSWKQGWEAMGWQGELVKQFGILKLPSNVLLDANGTLIARDISDKALRLKLDELLAKEKEIVTEKKKKHAR